MGERGKGEKGKREGGGVKKNNGPSVAASAGRNPSGERGREGKGKKWEIEFGGGGRKRSEKRLFPLLPLLPAGVDAIPPSLPPSLSFNSAVRNLELRLRADSVRRREMEEEDKKRTRSKKGIRIFVSINKSQACLL